MGVEIPGIIQSYAFVAAASGLSDEKVEGLKELQARGHPAESLLIAGGMAGAVYPESTDIR